MSNPFAAPMTSDARGPTDVHGPWRHHERLIVVFKKDAWPRRCVHCNAETPDDPPVPISVTYVPRWAYLLLLAGLLPYILVLNYVRRQGELRVHLCATHRRRRRTAQSSAALAAVAVVSGLGGGLLVEDVRWFLFGIAAIAPTLVLLRMASPLRARLIQAGRLELAGADRAFVASLPQWPGPEGGRHRRPGRAL